MKIHISPYINYKPHILRIEPDGRFDSDTEMRAEQEIINAIGDGIVHVVFNMQHVSYLGSVAIRVLMRVLKKCKGREGRVALVNLTPAAEKVIHTMEMEGFFLITKTEDAALQELS